MVVECEIKFSNPEKLFLSGQTISGEIELTLQNPIKIKRLEMIFEGFVKVQWEEYKEKINLTFEDREQHLYMTANLISTDRDLLSGNHVYEFKKPLPDGLPSSVYEKYGHVTYTCTVLIHRQGKPEIKFGTKFMVIQPVDLNWDPDLKNSYHKEVTKSFGCMFCKTRPISMVVSLPMRGVRVGQVFVVCVDITNLTNLEIHHINVSLLKKIDYRCEYPFSNFKRDVIVLKSVKIDERLKNEKKDFDVPFEIPETVESSQKDISQIFNVFYEILVKATTPSYHSNLKVEVPIVVGNLSQFDYAKLTAGNPTFLVPPKFYRPT